MDARTIAALSALFQETFFGVGNERGTWFNENAPESGLCGVLDRVAADVASKSPGPGRRSVAAHARHALVHVEHCTNWNRGVKTSVDWKASFEPGTATDAEWAQVRARLRSSCAALLESIKGLPDDEEDALAGAIGCIAHGAYHLGAIRQILADVGAPAARKG